MSEMIDPYGDDVLRMPPAWSIVGTHTFKVSEFVKALKDEAAYPALEPWFQPGVRCDFLRANTTKGWQKGRVRLRLEFIPDESDSDSDSVNDESLNQ